MALIQHITVVCDPQRQWTTGDEPNPAAVMLDAYWVPDAPLEGVSSDSGPVTLSN